MRTRCSLFVVAEPQLGGGKQAVDDHVVLADAVVDELGVAARTDDEERRHLALADAARELDVDLGAVIEGAQRPPGRRVAFDLVAEVERRDVDAGCDGLRRQRGGILPAQRDELVLRILPGHRGHIGLLGRAQLEMIGAPVGVDDEVGLQVGPRRLDQDMDCAWSRLPRFRCRR